MRGSYQLYAIYDGHGTKVVSEHLRHTLLAVVAGLLDNGMDFSQASMIGIY
jgi:serine/threonine protein phosphatase PrpC